MNRLLIFHLYGITISQKVFLKKKLLTSIMFCLKLFTSIVWLFKNVVMLTPRETKLTLK